MIKKNIMNKLFNKLIPILTFAVVFASCVRVEGDLFEESAAIRLNKSISNLTDMLIESPNGWIMEYFPNVESSGVIFLVDFISTKEAKMATINPYVKKYTEANGYWRIISDMGPVLTFDTYNDIFHIFSDPVDPSTGESDGVGLGGDYEFLIVSSSPEAFQLKGKKNGTNILLKKMPENKVWEEYFEEIENMKKLLFSNNLISLRLTVDGVDTLTLKNGMSQIFTTIPRGGTEVDDADELPFMVTDRGIKFANPFRVGDKYIQNFTLNDEQSELLCTDEGVDAKIHAVSADKVFLEVLNQKKYLVMTPTDEQMGSVIKDAYNLINSAVVAGTRKLDFIGFANNKEYGFTLAIMSSKGTSKAEGNIAYIFEENQGEVQLSLSKYIEKDKDGNEVEKIYMNQGGANYMNNFAANTLVNALEGQYNLSVVGPRLSSTTFRFEDKQNNDKWFVVSLK